MAKGAPAPKIVDTQGAKSSNSNDKLDSHRGTKKGPVRPMGGKR